MDSQADAGKLTAARLNGDFDPLYACLDPATGGLEDTNVKSGAKIVCTDRAHTVTGVWTFTTAPVLPAGSVADSKLTSNVMLKTTYDADLDGRVSLAVDSDTVDGSHAAAFAAAAHNHNLNDLTEKSYASLTNKPMMGMALAIGGGYAATVVDSSTYYLGNPYGPPTTDPAVRRMYCPMAGTIKVVYFYWYAQTAGSGDNISVYIRLNDTSDTLIATIGNTAASKVFSKTDLSIAVVQGDYYEIKVVCPAWATNPADVFLSGVVYIE
jgi:hypothetical protein